MLASIVVGMIIGVFPLIVGVSIAPPDPVAACHGHAVSRSCQIQQNLVRLEAVSYYFGTQFNQIYAAADYFRGYNWFYWGYAICQYCQSYTHGIWWDGYFFEYQVQGYHAFDHGQGWYGLPSSYTNGVCFASETHGC